MRERTATFEDTGTGTVRVSFDEDDVADGFAVDANRRTISGLAVPWGKIASSGLRKYRFERGSLRWSDTSRVKLNLYHDSHVPVGRAVELSNTDEGLRSQFRIARGEEGDRALTLAEDGVLDGMSIEVDFADDGLARDPGDDSVFVVREGRLRGVALTAHPAFDDARVDHVLAASRDDGARRDPGPLPVSASRFTSPDNPRSRRPAHPLGVTAAALTAVQAAIDTRSPARFVVGDPDAQFATLTTATIGGPRVWGANDLRSPRLLHVVSGVPVQPASAIEASFPQLTLPTAQPSVGEGATMVEYASSAAGSVTMGRFGRWTDLSRESLVGANASAILQMHRLGISLDLDQVLVDAVQTAAGAPLAFAADVPAQIRKAMARVSANTATDEPGDLVVLVNPDDADLLEDISPISGSTIAERFQRFSGALVYPSNSQASGIITVANLRVGARYFEAIALETVTLMDPRNATMTEGTFLVAGYGVTLTAGFAIAQDVTSA